MAQSGLLMRLTRDDGHWHVSVSVRSGDFSGRGEAWVDESDIRSLAEGLQQYPLTTRPAFAVGHHGSPSGRMPPQITISLRFFPTNAKGQVGVRVELERALATTEEERTRVGVELLTSYEPVRAFVRALTATLAAGGGEAFLAEEIQE